MSEPPGVDGPTDTPVQGSFEGMPRRLFVASPSKLLAFLDCPLRYRFQYVDRPAPPRRAQRAHTSLGQSVHNALRDWWDLPPGERTPAAGAALVRSGWIPVGFRDADQSARWRDQAAREVTAYLGSVDPGRQPTGVERTVSFVTGEVSLQGRVDRLDERLVDGERRLVVVDYKTSRRPLHPDDARTSLALGLYAAAVWKMFRRRCVTVELHHTPTGEVLRHEHTDASLTRKVEQARSIAADARRAEDAWRVEGEASGAFPARPGPLCPWCDLRAHCPAGQAEGPERSDWAALEDDDVPVSVEVE